MMDYGKFTCVELRKYYYMAAHCPFCGASPEKDIESDDDFKPCPHTVFAGHSEAWVYLSKTAEQQLLKAGYTVENDFGDVVVARGDDEEHSVTIQEVAKVLDFPDGVMFENYPGSPGEFYSFVAFGVDGED